MTLLLVINPTERPLDSVDTMKEVFRDVFSHPRLDLNFALDSEYGFIDLAAAC
jgi:hypothetical protein